MKSTISGGWRRAVFQRCQRHPYFSVQASPPSLGQVPFFSLANLSVGLSVSIQTSCSILRRLRTQVPRRRQQLFQDPLPAAEYWIGAACDLVQLHKNQQACKLVEDRMTPMPPYHGCRGVPGVRTTVKRVSLRTHRWRGRTELGTQPTPRRTRRRMALQYGSHGRVLLAQHDCKIPAFYANHHPSAVAPSPSLDHADRRVIVA